MEKRPEPPPPIDKVERICRAICVQRGIDPDGRSIDMYGCYHPKWQDFKELVEAVQLITLMGT